MDLKRELYKNYWKNNLWISIPNYVPAFGKFGVFFLIIFFKILSKLFTLFLVVPDHILCVWHPPLSPLLFDTDSFHVSDVDDDYVPPVWHAEWTR